MSRPRRYVPLQVFLNSRNVGQLAKHPGGGIEFRYDSSWLYRPDAVPISLSLPLREDTFRGEAVIAVFDNLLPDSESVRRRLAEKVKVDGIDAFSLLSQIGRDCTGALQLIPIGSVVRRRAAIDGRILSDDKIEALLHSLSQTPLGVDPDQEFRISVAGAQEKTALLRYRGKWMIPRGTTPTTHIFKTRIGKLPNGMDLSNSVENEYYCLRLLNMFGLPVNSAEIRQFGGAKALVIERFDRKWIHAKRLLRLPQEDLCQALSFPPNKKYQSDGGPGMVAVLKFLNAADKPADEQFLFLKAQILFWLIGAPDGHAKNFSIFLGPQGRFHLTPFYDVMSAQPSVDARHIERKHLRLAMSVGSSRHYRVEEIHGRHFIQTVEAAGLPAARAVDALREVATIAPTALGRIEKELPADFPGDIHRSVAKGITSRLKRIEV